jgi:hypothetical protein
MDLLKKIGAGKRRRGSRGHKGGNVLKNLGLQMGGNPDDVGMNEGNINETTVSGGNEKKERFLGINYGGTDSFDSPLKNVGGYSRDGVKGGNHVKTGGRTHGRTNGGKRKSKRGGRKSRRSRRRSRSSRK